MSVRASSLIQPARSEPAPSRAAGHAHAAAVEVTAMRAALRLARRGIGTTHPNPRVGAVILRGGATVGEGHHARAGEAHAEVIALENAGPLARGATLVATLEPCAHVGRTPPCVDAILRAGIRRVVMGMRDPNPLVNGRGARLLREAGVEVVEGVLEAECRALNPAYLKHVATGLPWVMLKSMVSLDGRMSAESGESRGLGGDAEVRLAHRLRAAHDAVLVGIGTALADDPELTVRRARGRDPLRVLLDSSLRLPVASRLLVTARRAPLVVATVSRDAARIGALEAAGASVWSFDATPEGRVPLTPLLRRLAAGGVLAILAEGGAAVHSALLREGLADRVAVGVAPLLLGGRNGSTWTHDLGRERLADGIPLASLRVRRLGRDLWIEGDIVRGEGTCV
jgi:diaminohydroxyphosphoribosylaminopyrimidine deaminase/5-amino-6-(5-phosphoribosylamino)uracil reductase